MDGQNKEQGTGYETVTAGDKENANVLSGDGQETVDGQDDLQPQEQATDHGTETEGIEQKTARQTDDDDQDAARETTGPTADSRQYAPWQQGAADERQDAPAPNVQGPQGPQGTGNTGWQSAPAPGPQGPQGPGDSGWQNAPAPGPQGPQGTGNAGWQNTPAPGPQGPQGPWNTGWQNAPAPGPQGTQGTGNAGWQSAPAPGPQGPQGTGNVGWQNAPAPGAQGPQGTGSGAWQPRNGNAPQQRPYPQGGIYQPPYPQNMPPQKPPVNNMAVASMVLGIASILLSCCCFPVGFIISFALGMAGLALAIISKKGQPFSAFAIAGLVLSILGICGSLFIFGCYILTSLMLKDPEYSALFNEIFQQYYNGG